MSNKKDWELKPIGLNFQTLSANVDDAETIRLQYQGEWYEVIKTGDGLELELDDTEQTKQ